MMAMESCVTTLHSAAFQPSSPHVVRKAGDTIFARSVIIKDRFFHPLVIAANDTFSKDEIWYAHTNWGHRYYVVHNRIVEQLIAGKINVFKNGAHRMQHKPWHLDDSGRFSVSGLTLGWLQKPPSQAFLAPDDKTIALLVNDYEPARLQLQKAKQMKSYSSASIVAGSALASIGGVLILVSLVIQQNQNASMPAIIGISSVAVSIPMFSVALPAFVSLAKRHRALAIERYNRGGF